MTAGQRPPLGIGHLTFLDLPPLDFAALAARCGYAAVSLRLYPAAPGTPVYSIPAGSAEMRAMRALLANEGMAVYDVEVVGVDKAFDPESLKPVFATAAELGAKRLNICGDDPDQARLAARIARLCEMASEVDMGVDIEFMKWRPVDSLTQTVALIEASGMTNAGVLIDALHLARCGGTPDDVAALPQTLVRSAQLCDAPARAPATTDAIIVEARSNRLLPGHGGLPLNALIEALPDDVVYSVELPMTGKADPERRARAIFEATMALFA